MPGLTFSNELISRDEALHTEFAVLMYSKLNKKIRKDKIIELIPNPLYIKKSLILAPNFPKIFEFISFLSKKLFSEL